MAPTCSNRDVLTSRLGGLKRARSREVECAGTSSFIAILRAGSIVRPSGSGHQVEDIEGPQTQDDVTPRRLELGAADRDGVAGHHFRIGVLAARDGIEIEAGGGALPPDRAKDDRLVERGDLGRATRK